MNKFLPSGASYCTAGPSRSHAHGRPWFPIPIPKKFCAPWSIITKGHKKNCPLCVYEFSLLSLLQKFSIVNSQLSIKLDCDFLSGITDCFGLALLAVLD